MSPLYSIRVPLLHCPDRATRSPNVATRERICVGIGGQNRSKNVGLSHANVSENPIPRKPKDSTTRIVYGGIRRGRENASSQCSSTKRYSAEVTPAILLGKARTTFNKMILIHKIDTGG
ncbi:hypothetical protein HN51_019927 [Arachis hypogaea]